MDDTSCLYDEEGLRLGEGDRRAKQDEVNDIQVVSELLYGMGMRYFMNDM